MMKKCNNEKIMELEALGNNILNDYYIKKNYLIHNTFYIIHRRASSCCIRHLTHTYICIINNRSQLT